MSLTVVVADDEPALRAMIRLMLERDERFRIVAEAHDGEQAMQLVEQHDPDLLLLDLGLPVLDGLQVLERLHGRARPRVVVLTGFVDPDIEKTARELGASAFLTKGVSLTTITDVLAE